MKITVIGGGSTYTPELVNGFLKETNSLPIEELCLMDTDPERLEIVGGFVQRMVDYLDSPFQVTLLTNQEKAIADARYVITQFRVGKMNARINDEYLGSRHGLIGQETTGIGGMAKALRTIPVMLTIAQDMEKFAPGALLVNFTNPAGLITEALFRYAPSIQSLGICNVAITTKMDLLKTLKEHLGLNLQSKDANLDTLGLNHLTWHRGLTIQGKDFWPEILELYLNDLKAQTNPEWPVDLIHSLQMIPNYYLHYFYQTKEKLAGQESWPPSRGEEVLEIEKGLLSQYASPKLHTPPEALMKRGGAWYSTIATQILASHYNDTGEMHVANVRNDGAVSDWSFDWVLELLCQISKSGIQPIKTTPLPPSCFGLISTVKAYELHTVEAAVNGDRTEAYLALLAHPLGPSADQANEVLEDLLETNRDFLPQFFT
ncbi:MAG: 6-phospho-beta-glucosidase [Anaerolineales bacterium]